MDSYLDNPERKALYEALQKVILAPGDTGLDDAGFNDLALRVFRYQFDRCAPFQRLCLALGISPAIGDWRLIPCVPTDAFKYHRMTCFKPRLMEEAFHTSGTTQGSRGIHVMPEGHLYGVTAWKEFGRHLLPEASADGYAPSSLKFISLTDTPDQAPHSSLVRMIADCADCFARRDPRSGEPMIEYLCEAGMLDFDRTRLALEQSIERREPVLICATAFALVRLLDQLEADKMALPLPEGSRMMETGGYKGRARQISREEIYAKASALLGLPTRSIVNEYGMTEMSSQFYDRTLSSPVLNESEARIKIPPAWVRSRVIHPVTGAEVAEGEAGIVQHCDLANLDSCAFLQTADVANRRGAGFLLQGRIEEAELRGCSLDYEG